MRTFCTVSSRADTARTRRRCIRLCARSRFAPRARRAAGARQGGPVVDVAVVASGRGRRGLCGAAPPASSPLPRPGSSRPSDARSLSASRHRGQWVTSGGPGRIRSKRLDPGAPTTPRPAIAGRPVACRGYNPRLPLPPHQDMRSIGETSGGARRLPGPGAAHSRELSESGTEAAPLATA